MADRKLYGVYYQKGDEGEIHFAYVYAKNKELAKEIVRKLTSTRLVLSDAYAVDEIECGLIAFLDGHFYEGVNF